VIAVKNANRKVARDPGARYAKLLDTHKRMEAELSRAMNRWQKSRKALWAAEKKLDAAFNREAEVFAGASDATDFDDMDRM
jgi:hypothetical protein